MNEIPVTNAASTAVLIIEITVEFFIVLFFVDPVSAYSKYLSPI